MLPAARCLALLALLCVGCDVDGPEVGSPGLEPPRSTDDAGAVPEMNTGGSASGAVDGSSGAGGGAPDLGGGGGASAQAGAGGGPAQAGQGAGGGGGAGGAGGAGGTAGAGGAGGAPAFSTEHAAEIMHDCQATVLCQQQRGEPLQARAIEICVTTSSTQLDNLPDSAMSFLLAYGLCSQYVVCDYVDCIERGQ